MKRPTFFLSSTIYDFRDLRSALKFYLESQGCTVLASEFNDFTKPLDKHSYEACLQAIEAADYFVLLIGTRVGGWFDEANQISITQREYREAHRLHKAGKIKLINLVRAEVWQVRDEHNGLTKYLETLPMDDATKHQIAKRPSKFAEDAEFLSSFITEVCRNAETIAAVKGKGKPPTGNWTHVFTGFRDVVDVLRSSVLLSRPVEEEAVRRLLRGELRRLLGKCLVKYKAWHVYAPRATIDAFHAQHPIRIDDRDQTTFQVETEIWDRLTFLAYQLLGLKLDASPVQQALTSTAFLEFDVSSDTFRETLAYDALILLKDNLRELIRVNTNKNRAVLFKYSPKRRSPGATRVRIEKGELLAFLYLIDRWSNVIDLTTALLRHLDGRPFVIPDLRPDSPIIDFEAVMEAERPTADEIDVFLRDHITNLGTTV